MQIQPRERCVCLTHPLRGMLVLPQLYTLTLWTQGETVSELQLKSLYKWQLHFTNGDDDDDDDVDDDDDRGQMSWLLTVTEAMCLHTMLQQTLHTGTGYLTSTGVNFNSTHFNMQYNKYYTLLHWPKQYWLSNNISTTTLSVLWCWDKNVVHHCHLSKINDIMKVWATALQQPLWQGVRASVLPDQGSQLHTHTIPDDTDKGSSSTIPDDTSS